MDREPISHSLTHSLTHARASLSLCLSGRGRRLTQSAARVTALHLPSDIGTRDSNTPALDKLRRFSSDLFTNQSKLGECQKALSRSF
mmetsp:Transcript_3676/g.10469  ORF Transcript_3676/g.10469 Transcript_3676/m.10469 type:complete len:87 (+) Transcript_3676:4641-4901(+)